MAYRYEISWMLQGRVIFVRLEGDLESAGIPFIQTYDAEINRYLNDGTAPLIHIIVDMTAVAALPSFREMAHTFTFPGHPRTGWAITVGARVNPVFRMVTHLTTQIVRMRFRQVDTMEDAFQFLLGVDTTLGNADAQSYA